MTIGSIVKVVVVSAVTLGVLAFGVRLAVEMPGAYQRSKEAGEYFAKQKAAEDGWAQKWRTLSFPKWNAPNPPGASVAYDKFDDQTEVSASLRFGERAIYLSTSWPGDKSTPGEPPQAVYIHSFVGQSSVKRVVFLADGLRVEVEGNRIDTETLLGLASASVVDARIGLDDVVVTSDHRATIRWFLSKIHP